MLGLVARGLALAGVVCQAALAQTGGPAPVQIPPSPDRLTQTTWQWLETDHGVAGTLVAADPSRYLVTFREDGLVAIRADCNRVSGGYTLDGAAIDIRPGPSTLAACPPDSQAMVFVRDLALAATYAFRGDNLALTLRPDDARMLLAPV